MECTSPPNSVLWAPLPVISWLLPGVGHVAVSDSHGNIHDFAGSYLVNVRLQDKGSSAANDESTAIRSIE